MTEVSVVGLGSMGTALARAFLRGGRPTTVWNRSPVKMQPLVADGAAGAPSVAAAVQASPAIVVCVDDYAVTRDLLGADEVRSALSGRVLIQLSTGTPREAREAESWFEGCGAAYIDGAILGGPASIGTDSALVLFGGPRPAFERCESLLACLGGNLRHLGENVAAAAVLDLAWLCQRFGLFVGLAHGALLCESEGTPLDLYASMFPESDRARTFLNVIHGNAYERPSATLAAWQAALQRVLSQGRDAGIDCEILEFIAGLFERAVAAGFAREDVAALSKVLRRGGS